MSVKIIGESIPNIPWQDRPAGCSDPVWRYDANPIIPRDAVPSANSVFNSAVVPFEGGFAGVFRIDTKELAHQLHVGFSDNGIDWDIREGMIDWQYEPGGIGPFNSGYDPRVCWVEDRYYVTWCNGYQGAPTIGVGWTKDFQTFHLLENAFLPYNRNGVLFPRKLDGKYVMLSRPSDDGHTAFGDIWLSSSPDMIHWGCHRLVMRRGGGWQWTKVGAGPIPIETTEGWLLIYHGVWATCSGFNYTAGAALLDLDDPTKVIARTSPYILSPREYYECVGDVPNVTFPCAALVDADTGRIALYYGAADTVVAMAFTTAEELIEFTKANSM